MKEFQEKVADFNLARGWDKDTRFLKDFLLNMCEEAGEAWSVIKWIDGDKQSAVIAQHKDKFEDYVGDSLFLILKIAWLLDIDSEKALDTTLKEYELRFPVDRIKEVKHGNPLAGGIDDKQNVTR